jgi:hypothetical protein
MIKFGLECDNGHNFEGWFESSTGFDSQKKRGFLECPVCGSGKVDRAIMAPMVARTDLDLSPSMTSGTDAEWVNSGSDVSIMSPEERDLRKKLSELRAEMIKNADDVGEDFAEEARRIHFGETKSRQIYGHTSLEEARDLIDEGIDIFPLPPGTDHN